MKENGLSEGGGKEGKKKEGGRGKEWHKVIGVARDLRRLPWRVETAEMK